MGDGGRFLAFPLLLFAGVPAAIIVASYVGRATGNPNLDLLSGVITLAAIWGLAFYELHVELSKGSRK